VPGAPAPAPGTIALAPEGAPGGVLADIALVFGESFVEHAVVDTLLVDGTEKAPGEAINYSASGLTPGGDVLLILARTTAPDTFHTQELVADGTGSVAGQISLPSDAASGHWLITAVDLQPMRAALQDYTDNNASGDVLVFPLAANSVVVPDWNYLPAFSR
jgi:hypothetical protein